MSNPVSSLIFCCRNVDKVEYEDKMGRLPVAIAQANNVFQAVQKLDNVVGHKAQNASAILQDFAKEQKAFEYVGKGVKILSKQVNPLICLSSGLDVLKADDKEKALITNASMLGAMFYAEKQMKDHLDKVPKMEMFKGITKKVMEFAKKHKCEKGLPAVAHGVAFVTGSIVASNLGEKFGSILAKGIKAERNEEKA